MNTDCNLHWLLRGKGEKMADIGIKECLLFLGGLLLWQFIVIAVHFWREGKRDDK